MYAWLRLHKIYMCQEYGKDNMIVLVTIVFTYSTFLESVIHFGIPSDKTRERSRIVDEPSELLADRMDSSFAQAFHVALQWYLSLTTLVGVASFQSRSV